MVKNIRGNEEISINHWNVLRNFLTGKKTFGESENLRKLIEKSLTLEEFETLKNGDSDVVITVSNLSLNQVEYKSIKDCTYEDFCDWIWISCNLVPFMSLATKDGFEYADGGLACVVPIREAILRGATEVDAIILESENLEYNKVLGKNPFSLMINLFGHLSDQVEKGDIAIGRLAAKHRNVKLNLYFTPTKLTENSLIFNKQLMETWWQQGYHYAESKHAIGQPMDQSEKFKDEIES